MSALISINAIVNNIVIIEITIHTEFAILWHHNLKEVITREKKLSSSIDSIMLSVVYP